VTDRDVLESYRFDQAAPGLLQAGRPAALVRARSRQEVQDVIRVAAATRTPVVARGAGSGLSGGANALDGCIVLSLERMTRIVEVDSDSMTAVVEPGVVNQDLRTAVRSDGLWYAPDPASMEFSTLGGNIATNAGGLCCVKYGVTREAVLGLELVLADGTVAEIGRRTRKGTVGYDLASLFCGSEGTLGIITAATLMLQPLPSPAITLVASFSALEAAGGATAQIVKRSRPSMVELMDRTTIRAVERFQPMELDPDAAALVFARTDTGGETARHEAEQMGEICDELGAELVVVSEDEAEGRLLMAARRLAYPALERLGATLLDDVAVPIARVADLVLAVERIAQETDLLIGTFGHAGDGNLHPTIVYDRSDSSSVAAAQRAFAAIVRAALDLGGTATGEHGVGLLKREFLDQELGNAASLHRKIKHALDPESLLNPGKAL
jgi:glycolate oxidase